MTAHFLTGGGKDKIRICEGVYNRAKGGQTA